MKTRLLAFAVSSGVLGCNAIFGITEGTIGGDTGAGTQGGGGSTTVSQGGDGGTPSNGGAGGAPSNGGGGSTSDGGTGGEGGSVVGSECNPDNLTGGESIGEDCGIFVKAGATGTGTKADPMGSITSALSSVPHGKAVYVCGTDAFTGGGRLESNVGLFGALDCATWSVSAGNRPTLQGTAGEVALLVVGNPGDVEKVQDFIIAGGGPAPARLNSIAVFVTTTVVDFTRVDIVAPNAGVGTDATGVGVPAQFGPSGVSAISNCQASGPPGGQNTCLDPNGSNVVTSGGQGAACSSTMNTAGQDGSPFGFGGTGGTYLGTSCSPLSNQAGAQGQYGQAGPGGAIGGMITNADYILPPVAPTAGRGGIGGGGGGGGARQNNTGGGGGAGGCGGEGGLAGGPGGANFPVMLFQATANFTQSRLTASRGGGGGKGAAGQPGGNGGSGGSGLSAGVGCTGGPGGSGGRGGLAGGGAGGPAALVGMTNDSTATADAATKAASSGQTGGQAGQGGTDGTLQGASGQMGMQCQVMAFTAGNDPPSACQMFP